MSQFAGASDDQIISRWQGCGVWGRERFIYNILCWHPRCGAACPSTCVPVLM